jgi:hypothetical protein
VNTGMYGAILSGLQVGRVEIGWFHVGNNQAEERLIWGFAWNNVLPLDYFGLASASFRSRPRGR